MDSKVKQRRAERKLISRVLQVAYHRNGIAGAGFYAVIFETETVYCANPKCNSFDGAGWIEAATGKPAPCVDCKGTEVKTVTERMLASVFDEAGHVAVLAIDKLVDPEIGVAFGENSWRGDQYEPELRAAIANNESDGSIRIGSFAIPTKRKTKGQG